MKDLAELRANANLTQEELARRLSRHRSFIWKIEGGERRIDLIEFIKWCRACGADPDRVFRRVSAAVPNR